MSDVLRLPEPSLIVLVGPSAAGKSTWAASHFTPGEIVSSDALRAMVGNGQRDLDASADAFDLLERIVDARIARRLTTVVDTLGFDESRRHRWRDIAHAAGLHSVLVVFDTAAPECRARNAARPDAVPRSVLDQQLRRMRDIRGALDADGFDRIIAPDAVRVVAAQFVPDAVQTAATSERPTGLTFGLHLSRFSFGGPARTRDALATIAREAETAGFSAIYVMDHFRQIPQLGRAWEDMPECFTTLAWLAGMTTTVRLGSLVAAVSHRSVALLARSVATLDVLSGGRAVCGVGLGWFDAELRAVGMEAPRVARRYEMLEDALRALPLFWGPGTPAFDGHHLHVSEAMCYPRPLQARIPLLVGGSGEKRTLALAARHADACNLFGQAPDVRSKVDVLRRHCATAGRDPEDVDVTHLSTIRIGAHSTRRRGRGVEVNAGTIDDHRIRFAALRDAGVRHAIVAFDELVDHPDGAPLRAFAPLIAEMREQR